MGQSNRTTRGGIAALLVIAAIALWELGVPLLYTYSVKHHVALALDEVAAVKLAVMESATVRGGLARVHPDTLHYHVPQEEYLSRVDVADGGLITLTTQDTGANPDPVIVLVPVESRNGDVVWSCQVFQGDPALVPPGCRNDSLAAHDALPESSRSSSVIGIR